MNFFKRLTSLFSGGSAPTNRHLTIYVLSRRCNEPIAGQIDLLNELSQPDEGDSAYYVRKVFSTSGQKRCFGQVEVELWLNSNKQVTEHTVQGGRWLEAEEYERELARFNAPPPEESEQRTEDSDQRPETKE
jgi:hypothetical protein